MEIENEVRRLYDLPSEELYALSKSACRKYYGNTVFLRGLLEFSNYCNCACKYCGISTYNKNIPRYRLTPNDIIYSVKKYFSKGYRTFVIQGGEDPAFSDSDFCNIISEIKNITGSEGALTLSLGRKSYKSYKLYKEAGADRYLLRFETSDPIIFKQIKNFTDLEDRINALYELQSLGYETGTGFLIGLPGETEETIIQNLILTIKLNPHMIGIGPFIPHPETPLRNIPQGNIEIVKRATAILRILLPKTNIPATTASFSINSDARSELLQIGANVLMPNIGPSQNKDKYELYPGKSCSKYSNDYQLMLNAVKAAGKTIDNRKGNSIAFENNYGGNS